MSAPERIYLQDGCDDPGCEEHDNYEGVTWCKDRIHDSDTEYVRADLLKAARARIRQLEKGYDELRTVCNRQQAQLRTAYGYGSDAGEPQWMK